MALQSHSIVHSTAAASTQRTYTPDGDPTAGEPHLVTFIGRSALPTSATFANSGGGWDTDNGATWTLHHTENISGGGGRSLLFYICIPGSSSTGNIVVDFDAAVGDSSCLIATRVGGGLGTTVVQEDGDQGTGVTTLTPTLPGAITAGTEVYAVACAGTANEVATWASGYTELAASEHTGGANPLTVTHAQADGDADLSAAVSWATTNRAVAYVVEINVPAAGSELLPKMIQYYHG